VTRQAPRLDDFDPGTARRIAMTVSCTDADAIPKVEGAGQIRDHGGRRVQVMHNGLIVEEGGYYGAWMTEVIRTLQGHHEPQEERVFDAIVRRLRDDGAPCVMIEFGSFWAYYSLWFCHTLPGSRAVALEPDFPYLGVGRRNAALNGSTTASPSSTRRSERSPVTCSRSPPRATDSRTKSCSTTSLH